MRMARAFRRTARRFAENRNGATAIEFAMVLAPFMFLMFACFEYILVYWVTVTLDNATMEAARRIRTGEAQSSSATAATFKQMVCDQMGWLQSECPGALSVDARVFASFTGATDPDPTSGGTFSTGQLRFNMGARNDIVMVTTYYKWKLLTGALDGGLSTPWYQSGYRAVIGRAVFRNEPF